MAIFKSFKAIRYNFSKAGAPEKLCAPPYDIVGDPAEWTAKSPYNILRLEGGERLGTPDPYADAQRDFEQWMTEGILAQDPVPAFYLYQARFPSVAGGVRTVTGLAGHVGLTPFADGVVLPHENTLSKAKADRRRLMETTGCHFSPIYCLYHDGDKKVAELLKNAKNQAPDCCFTMEDGVEYTLWTLADPALCTALTDAFADKTLFIADGHHRYETSLHLHQDNPERVSPYVMTVLADMDDPGLEVQATHRMLWGLKGYAEEEIKAALSQSFTLTPGDTPSEGVPVWVTARGCYRLESRQPGTYPLDVTLLHEGILEPIFGIDPKNMAAGQNLGYTRDAAQAAEKVRSGGCQCAFLMAPPTISQIRGTMLRGEKMPQKSTYFYPKIITGLFMNRCRMP